MSSDTSGDVRSDEFDELPMRIGVGQFMDPSEKRLRYIKQLGVDDILLNMYQYDPDYEHMPDDERMPLEGDGEWSVENLVALRERVEAAGIRLNAIENVPISFYEDVMLNGPKRDEQLEKLKRTIRNMGEAGIPIFGYHWAPAGVWRTGSDTVRGGATVSSFDADDLDDEYTHDREYTEEELWENYEYFLEEVIPVAEEAGIKLCLHPNDPPMERLGGVPQLFRNFENFKRAMDLVPSDNHGLELCLGCWSQMGEDVAEVIRYFGERDEIFYVHFRDVDGTVPAFKETFVDEGNYDEYALLALLDEVGFEGMMIPDHTPHLEDDTDWEHRGRAFTVGYLRGMLRGRVAETRGE
ncbi:mannonate dehydratase [Natronorubrum texcoconense]|uniref:mannonate dehydratase n=1 Tax=Natronorubrum texcoconense TaxID=1095776 RepID=A0A1G9CTD1_9EURY|nr:mannonate dehydratase [Natronorubrum texcoconense]SDK54930.1 mannonate dehydratase [Natronorubrum texcoconense]